MDNVVRVLVVEGRGPERNALLRSLDKAPYQVQLAADVASAKGALAVDPLDLVLVGIPMQGGADTIAELRAADAAGRAYLVAVLDSNHPADDLPALFAAGAHDFVRRSTAVPDLFARVQIPARMRARMASKRSAPPNGGGAKDPRALKAFTGLGAIVAEELSHVVGKLQIEARKLSGTLSGATIPMLFTKEALEIGVCVFGDATSRAWLGNKILGRSQVSDEALRDIYRELAHLAGSAIRRAAAMESVALCTGSPSDGVAAFTPSPSTRTCILSIDGGRAFLGVSAQIRAACQRVPATQLKEGMVVVDDVRNGTGAVLLPAGTRLTCVMAERIGKVLGAGTVVEVAECPSAA